MFSFSHFAQPPYFFFFNDTATTEIYTLSHTTLFRSLLPSWGAVDAHDFDFHRPIMRPSGSVKSENRSEEHTSELQSRSDLVCRLLLEKKNLAEFRQFPTLHRAR